MNILNIINFVRAVKPRDPNLDLYEPVKKQLELSQKYQFPTTFMLQYDSLLDERYFKLLHNQPDIEIGVWLEVVQPLVESIGLKWRGREGWAWDWYSNVGLTVGYTVEERKRIADELMRKFKEVFGYYPKTVGSWLIDSATLNYLYEQYGIVASCNCKDQWGTDGYSIWGGYYNQGYYPSKLNVITPASSSQNQINVPVFRMLGSDPVDQYDLGVGGVQGVITLEPVYMEGGGGGQEEWVRWFLGEIYNGKCLSFGYTQAGQENGFGWDAMERGYTFQMQCFDELRKKGSISVLTLEQTGRWFKENYKTTPASSIVAKKEDKDSVWYYSRHYRSNFYIKDGIPRIRDIFYFNDLYEERYLNDVCTSRDMRYDNLPVMDGNRWSTAEKYAGIYFVSSGEIVKTNHKLDVICENGVTSLQFDDIKILYREDKIIINSPFILRFIYDSEKSDTQIEVFDDKIMFNHNSFSYALKTNAKIVKSKYIELEPQDNRIVFEFAKFTALSGGALMDMVIQ